MIRWKGKITWARLLMRSCSLDVNANRLERGNLLQKGGGVNHDSVSDHCQHTRPKDAAGYQLEYELPFTYEDGVAGVVSALVTSDRLEFFGEQVDDFTFAFIAPLGPEHNEIAHELLEGRTPNP